MLKICTYFKKLGPYISQRTVQMKFATQKLVYQRPCAFKIVLNNLWDCSDKITTRNATIRYYSQER